MEYADEAPLPAELLSRRVDVNAALNELGENERALVVLRYRHGLDYSELASVFGLKEGTVRMRLSRALGRMRSALDQRDEASGRASAAPARARAAAHAPPPAAFGPPPPPAPGARPAAPLAGGAPPPAPGAPPPAGAPLRAPRSTENVEARGLRTTASLDRRRAESRRRSRRDVAGSGFGPSSRARRPGAHAVVPTDSRNARLSVAARVSQAIPHGFDNSIRNAADFRCRIPAALG